MEDGPAQGHTAARKKRPSMIDVGRAAEVSAQTVSRFYTGGHVSIDARARIERAVAELGYQHSRLPQILRTQRTNAIGFLNMGPLNFGNSGILTGLSRAARLAGQSLLTSQLDWSPEDPSGTQQFQRAVDALVSMRVDGIVVGTPYPGIEHLLERVAATVPVVCLSEATMEGIIAVHADSYGAARLAVRHLIGLGHERIVHLAGPDNRNEAAERVRGYADEVAAAGFRPQPLVRCAEWDAESGAAASRLLDVDDFTGIFAANDEIALGAMSELRDRGLEAPRDYSIVGVDDMPEAQYFSPPLTTSRLDFVGLGERALELVLGQVNGRDTPKLTVLPSAITTRMSAAAPPGSPDNRHRQVIVT